MVDRLKALMPSRYGSYIEPFFGGGALFFVTQPERAIIADSNPELINLYHSVAENVDGVIESLKGFVNTADDFYRVRVQDWTELDPIDAAARTVYLNKTSFNGLYRLNKKAQFNTPYGYYKNPTILDENNLRLVAKALHNATIICGDYLEVLREHAKPGDFVFLDPPYIPVSETSNFVSYTSGKFYASDHKNVAAEFDRLAHIGCYVVLTNSNHPSINELYGDYSIEVIQTNRNIARKKGEDVIVLANLPSKFA
jgi:DNA adenine methylase